MKAKLIIVLLLCSNLISANISVFFTRGKVLVNKGKTGVIVQLKTGDSILPGTRVVLGKNSELIITNSNKQFALLRDSTAHYTYAELEKMLENCRAGSLLENLAKEIRSGLNHKPSEDEIRRLYLETKGGVTRADCHTNQVHFPGNNCIVSDAEVFFLWPAIGSSYFLQIEAYPYTDASKSVLVSKRLSDTVYVPNQVERELLKQIESIDWKVSIDSTEACFFYRVTIISDDSVNAIRSNVSSRIASLNNPVEKLLMQTAMFEEVGLLLDADRAYKELVALKENRMYLELYKLFKWRNGIN